MTGAPTGSVTSRPRCSAAARTDLAVAVDGARWVFPAVIAAAQAGDEVTVFTRGAPRAVTIAGSRTAVAPVQVSPVLLGRAVAGAEIAVLERQLASATGA